jgi:hypothetical protein
MGIVEVLIIVAVIAAVALLVMRLAGGRRG